MARARLPHGLSRTAPGGDTTWACSEPEFLGRQLGAGHPGADFRERDPARGGGVVAEWREAAFIASAQPAWFDVLRRLQHAVFYLFRRLDPRVNRVNHPDEDPLRWLGVLGDEPEHTGPVRLAGQLDIESADVQAEQVGSSPA